MLAAWGGVKHIDTVLQAFIGDYEIGILFLHFFFLLDLGVLYLNTCFWSWAPIIANYT